MTEEEDQLDPEMQLHIARKLLRAEKALTALLIDEDVVTALGLDELNSSYFLFRAAQVEASNTLLGSFPPGVIEQATALESNAS